MTDIARPTELLWTRTRAMYARAVAAIGDAAAIALLHALPRTLRRQIIHWLCPLEHIVRKLVFAEACEIHRAERDRAKGAIRIERVPLRGMAMHWRPGSGSASLQARIDSTVAEKCEPEGSRSRLDTSQPSTWRASFSFALPRDPHVVSNANAPRIRALWGPTPPPPPEPERAPRIIREEDAPFRLARRFEALRRVLDDPRPYAERLARILAREVRRYRQVIIRYIFAPCRSDGRDPNDYRLAMDAMGLAFVRGEIAFEDSS